METALQSGLDKDKGDFVRSHLPLCPALPAWSTMASTAALTQTTTAPPRFDAANHSGRLRYANARDLPSFPSSGLKKDGAAASAAASLGWANSSAGLHANNVRMASGPQPRRSTMGSQTAALAAGSAHSTQRQKNQVPPESTSWGNSAAVIAFNKSSNASKTPPDLSRQGSLRAAKGAMAGARPRARSSPMPKESYPDQANAASNALSAATIAHRQPAKTPVGEAGAVPITSMDRQMFTSHPPVQPEVDEQRRNDVIHASAVAMAKKMYSQQRSVINTDRANTLARSSSFTRHGAGTDSDVDEQQPTGFSNLQEAAYKLAQERLAKLQEEHEKNKGLTEYYGASAQQTRLGSLRSKLTRRRSASDGALIDDQRQSMRIRKQMSLFDTKLAQVDEEKRAHDREALLAVAHRNVQTRLKDMDEKIQEETGWVAPPRKEDWEWRARAAAQAKFEAAQMDNQGKVDIGGGKLMDREAVEAIAAQRIQPLLDEINEKAEREWERRAQLKAEEEKAKEEAEVKKAREKEIEELHKRIKDQQKEQDRARKAELKQEEKARKEDLKAARIEQKRIAKDAKGKGKEVIPPEDAVAPIVEPTQNPQSDKMPEPEAPASSKGHSGALSINFPKRISKSKPSDRPLTSDGDTAPSSTSKVKSWLRTHFMRPRSQSSPVAVDDSNKERKFVGGAALARLTTQNSSSPSVDERRSSMREVALAGRACDGAFDSPKQRPAAMAVSEPGGSSKPVIPVLPVVRVPSPSGNEEDDSMSLDTMSVSSLSSSGSSDRFEEARTTLSDVVPAEPMRIGQIRNGNETGRASPVRGSRFSELLE